MGAPPFHDSTVAAIAGFLDSIGIAVIARELSETTFFPGMKIERGAIVIDEPKLKHPGNLLHEAGHLAVVPLDRRLEMHGDSGWTPGLELQTVAWSYAAAVHLGFHPSLVFYKESYGGSGDNMIENFRMRRYVGVPGLQRLGMTLDTEKAKELGVAPYPAMLRWLR